MFSTIKAARLLGWASLAVGATELVATRWLEGAMGVERHGPLIKSYGIREIVAGVTILNQPGLNKALVAGLWARVVGDAADLATLSLASKESRKQEGLATVTSLVLGVTAMDLVVAFLAQRDLSKATAASQAARKRVHPTQARPKLTDGSQVQPIQS
jgi:hypothetical protein